MDYTEREKRRKELENMYGKPVFFVHELIYCPFFTTGITQTKIMEGIKAHRIIQEHFKSKKPSVRIEEEIVLDRGSYLLVGHIDILDVEERVVYEIKPAHLSDHRYLYQLSTYVAMMRSIEKIDYYGAWIAYRYTSDGRIRYSIIRPFYIITYILNLLDKVAEVAIRAGRRLTIGGPWCKKCVLKYECKPDIKYRHNNGFVEVEENG